MSELYDKPAKAADVVRADGSGDVVVEEKSPGVRRIEAISSCFTSWHKWTLFISIFLVAYAYGLDGTLRYTYQNFATAEWENQALISTLNVVRAVVAAAVQPAYAKISDYFGRVSILFLSVIFYVVGTIVMAAAGNMESFAGGAVIYQFGYSGMMILVEILIADTTSLRNRLFFSYIPAYPFIINAWVSGDISQAVMNNSTWRWGIGMWAIIFPVLTIPLFYSLISAERRAYKAGLLDDVPSPYRSVFKASLWKDFFFQADIIGLFFLAATIALILVPLTLAGGVTSSWRTARIITPLVVGGVVAFPCFVIWEAKFAPHPLMPFRVFKKLAVICGFGIALMLNTAWYTQGDYLFTTLQVAFGKDIKTSTYVTNVYSFTSTIVGMILGLTVRYVRRLKPFVVVGSLLFILAFGLLIRYRGGHSVSDFAGLVGAEVVLGIAGGFVPYTTQASLQAEVKHERTATITSLFYSAYNIGSGIGNTIAGAIWTNTMPTHLQSNLERAGVSNASAIATEVYGDPFTWIATNPIGTAPRDAVDLAYREVQRYLTIAGISISCLLFAFSLGLNNHRLTDKQSLDNAEGESVHSSDNDHDLSTTPTEVDADVREKAPRV
jgi:SIT family siderophore-iron:H+ symporter-like MFS transporter